MGFGFLTAGYYLTYLVGMIWKDELWGALIVLLGCVAIAMGLQKLSEYEKSFRSAMTFDLLMLLPALYRVFAWLSENLLWNTVIFSDTVTLAVDLAEFAIFLGFEASLLLSVRRLATGVEVPKIVQAAWRNLIFLGLYGGVSAVAYLPVSFAVYFSLCAMLLQILYHILIGIMLASCYMRICDEGDEEMPLKKSRFAWVNKMREERAAREQRAADSVTEYAEARLRKKQAARQRREHERKEARGNKKQRRR